MSIAVELPALGESVVEGTISQWLVQEGDFVQVDQPLLEVTTDKVDAEIWRRSEFRSGLVVDGPAIVEQLDSTTVVPFGWAVRSDDHGNLELTRKVTV